MQLVVWTQSERGRERRGGRYCEKSRYRKVHFAGEGLSQRNDEIHKLHLAAVVDDRRTLRVASSDVIARQNSTLIRSSLGRPANDARLTLNRIPLIGLTSRIRSTFARTDDDDSNSSNVRS